MTTHRRTASPEVESLARWSGIAAEHAINHPDILGGFEDYSGSTGYRVVAHGLPVVDTSQPAERACPDGRFWGGLERALGHPGYVRRQLVQEVHEFWIDSQGHQRGRRRFVPAGTTLELAE